MICSETLLDLSMRLVAAAALGKSVSADELSQDYPELATSMRYYGYEVLTVDVLRAFVRMGSVPREQTSLFYGI